MTAGEGTIFDDGYGIVDHRHYATRTARIRVGLRIEQLVGECCLKVSSPVLRLSDVLKSDYENLQGSLKFAGFVPME